jgi:hypothetical protein
MRPFDAAGNVLNATYSVEPDGTRLALIMESRSGRTAGAPARNADYNSALTILLDRLGRLDATILDALVDSERTQRLGTPEAQRRIIPGPIVIADERDLEALRQRMGSAQARVAAGGGAATRRIRLVLDVPGYGPDEADHLADILAVPAQGLAAPSAILERLTPVGSEPTAEDYEKAAAQLDGDLDRVVQTAYRVEQSYLRRLLFKRGVPSCDLCGRSFRAEFLVAAHIKKRSESTDAERRDVPNIVMSACRFGCDELYERGYISVADDGQLLISRKLDSSPEASAYATDHLSGKVFGRSMSGRAGYFAWHRRERFQSPGR